MPSQFNCLPKWGTLTIFLIAKKMDSSLFSTKYKWIISFRQYIPLYPIMCCWAILFMVQPVRKKSWPFLSSIPKCRETHTFDHNPDIQTLQTNRESCKRIYLSMSMETFNILSSVLLPMIFIICFCFCLI